MFYITRVGESEEVIVHFNPHAEDIDVTDATNGAETVTVATVEASGAESTEPEQNSNPKDGNTPTAGTYAYICVTKCLGIYMLNWQRYQIAACGKDW